MCTNDKYKDVYNDDMDKVAELICSITDEYPESTEYILGSKWKKMLNTWIYIISFVSLQYKTINNDKRKLW